MYMCKECDVRSGKSRYGRVGQVGTQLGRQVGGHVGAM